MTYEEAYMQCESIEELERMVNKDITFARVFNIDRIPIIEKSAIKNEEVWYICYKCGKCGRVFENGFMVDDGGTTIEEEQE